MELGLVKKINIDKEMRDSYLDYAMSVIVSRALPDARDGLKPVQRRILYAMYDMGIRADTPYKKSARIVGEVLGKYHPHGDQAVYDAMARMAQDFSVRCMLVDGQGNFGSVDGDPPAAMRYTEARLSKPAIEMLNDINKNTIDFNTNFDDTLTEPVVLPASMPNLLVNGATGIAVGMATSIPPHNLGEVTDGLIYMLENWEKLDDIDVQHLMEFIKGPDFPTGGLIIQEAGEEGIEAAYGSGRGKITIQAKAHYEEMDRGKNRVIITELPYQVNKANLIEKIAELARNSDIEGISDLRDESDRHGMRVVIELAKNIDPEKVLAALYKKTPMQTTFSMIILALVDGEPRLLTLKQALKVFLQHRLEVIRRRAEFDLGKARARAHILEGYLVALKNLDQIIDIIRKSPDADAAKTKLCEKFKLSDIQATAILDMQLRRLAALERKKIETEYKEVTALIKQLEALLSSDKLMRNQAAEELSEVKRNYSDARRTQIINLREGKQKRSVLTTTQILPDQPVWVGMDANGSIARSKDDKHFRPSGTEAPAMLLKANSTDSLYLVEAGGQAVSVAVHTLPEADKISDGVPFHKITPFGATDLPVAVFSLPKKAKERGEHFILSLSKNGMIKKSSIVDLPGPSSQTFTLCKVNPDDEVLDVSVTNGSHELLMATKNGMAIRFSEREVRAMGLVAAGVNAIKLDTGDEVVGLGLVDETNDCLVVLSNGHAKRVKWEEFPTQGRYGRGVSLWNLADGVTVAGLATGKSTQMITLHLLKAAAKSCRIDAAGIKKRSATRGDVICDVRPDDKILFLTNPKVSLFDKGKPKPELPHADQPTLFKEKAPQKKASKKTEIHK